MRTVFFGTPGFARTVLASLLGSSHEILAVVTNPDRPSGRGRKVLPGPVAGLAREAGLELFQPETLRDEKTLARLRELEADVFAVAACGFILPRAVLAMPRVAPVNAHASLLPRLRGAAPVEWAILRGLGETGVTVQRMVREVDAGDVYAVRRTPIGPRETAASLAGRLAEIAAELMPEVLDVLEAGGIACLPCRARHRQAPTPQDHSRATRAPRLTREDRAISWSEPAVVTDRRVRAFSPKPGAFAVEPEEVGSGLLKIIEAEPVDAGTCGPCRRPDRGGAVDADPGEVVAADAREGLVVATGGGGSLLLLTVQPEGKRAMEAKAFLRGHGLARGMKFGDGLRT